jgi:hypothetical protein
MNGHVNVTVNAHRLHGDSPSDRPGFQSLQRNVFRFNDPTVANNNGAPNGGQTAPLSHSAVDAPVASPKASTLPRNTHLMAPVSATSGGMLSAPGRRTAIDLSTNDDYVMFSALNQSAAESGHHRATNGRPTNAFGTYSVPNGKIWPRLVLPSSGRNEKLGAGIV